MDEDAIIRYVADTFGGVIVLRPTDGPGAGDTFFIYDPERNIEPQRQFPFATIVTKDYGEFDNASRLDRPGVFRLNIGLSRDTFRARFGAPSRAEESADTGTTGDTSYDVAALDQLMPHPVYATQSWVCVLNPSPKTFEEIKPLLAEAYARAADRFRRGQVERD